MQQKPAPSPLRRHWELSPGVVYLTHGTFGACPRPVLEWQSRLRSELESGPVQFLTRRYEEHLAPNRAALADFIGARPRDLVFTINATAGVNAVVRSLEFRPDDEILTTSHDYNACRNTLTETARRTGARVVVATIPFPLRHADEVSESVLRAVTPRTRLALIDHVTSPTALVFPVAQLVRALESRGVDTLVDGAHAPGMLPLNLAELRPAYYTGNLHKWVCAPKGAAFLWVREDRQAPILPPVISHGYNTSWPGETPFQHRFDWPGTFDPTPWLCVGEALRWMGALLPGGWPELQQRNRDLLLEARRAVCARLEFDPPCPEEMLGSMATLPLPEKFQSRTSDTRISPDQLNLFDRFGIEVPFIRFGSPVRRWFRLSAQIYNTRAEYDYLAEALFDRAN